MADEHEDDDRPRARHRQGEAYDDYDDEDDRPRRRRDEDSTGGLIPTKNKPALIGYYLGFLGLLPILGLVLAPAAVILGLVGISRSQADPRVRGTIHAVVAVILGLAGFFLCSPLWLFLGWAAFIGPK